jgi:putative mRNA 3-end processing factor
MSSSTLIALTASGLYCEAGDFYIDPWRPVGRAVLTHAHSDHAYPGNESYLVSLAGERLFRARLGDEARIETAEYGEVRTIGGVRLSLHPAGHVLGSAQVRVEYRGEVWVVSGDYKTVPDPTCAPFEPVQCHSFITEATFGLPIYRWPASQEVFGAINQWWRQNRDRGKASLLLAYALGKSQRILAGVDPTIGPIFTHGAVERLNREYRLSGVALPPTTYAGSVEKKSQFSGSLIVAPPSALGVSWTRRFGAHSTGFASGWMRIRGARRRRAVDRGFVMSDHADWAELLAAVDATGAEQIWVTHGYAETLARRLSEQGRNARPLKTLYRGDDADAAVDESADGAEGVQDGAAEGGGAK